MSIIGLVSKMSVKAGKPAQYELPIGETSLALNPYLGKKLSLQFTGKIHCLGCHQAIKKSYQNGYCFPCTQRLARCDFCILKPERCHFHLGTCREPEWGQTHCMIPHIVYLANTSGLKIGITRASTLPTRWLDQGATAALPIFEVSTRRISGFIEVLFAEKISDKTNWRAMLKGENISIDLPCERDNLFKMLSDRIEALRSEWGQKEIKLLTHSETIFFDYPILEYPKKVSSLSFDKTSLIEGTLLGIKGQYLIFDTGVLNIRKHNGYVLEIKQTFRIDCN